MNISTFPAVTVLVITAWLSIPAINSMTSTTAHVQAIQAEKATFEDVIDHCNHAASRYVRFLEMKQAGVTLASIVELLQTFQDEGYYTDDDVIADMDRANYIYGSDTSGIKPEEVRDGVFQKCYKELSEVL